VKQETHFKHLHTSCFWESDRNITLIVSTLSLCQRYEWHISMPNDQSIQPVKVATGHKKRYRQDKENNGL